MAARGRGLGKLAGGLAGLVLVLGAMAHTTAAQQIVPTPDPGRDCQTVRTCNFSRTGQVRGCLSSYTCRTCRMVRARCDVGGARKCERMVCSWGG